MRTVTDWDAVRCRDYFWHFDNEALKKRAPWRIFDLQGKRGLIFAGSSCCFESVLDVLAYNDRLFDHLGLDDADRKPPAELGAAADGDAAMNTA